MSATVWPPISHDDLIKEEEASLAAELEWLLEALQDTLGSLKSGLEECVALLAPQDPGTTLALSSSRSETVKGFVTRIGTRVVKGDISLRLPTLPPPRPHSAYPLHISSPLVLPQLSSLLTLLNQSLDIIDISTWTGDPHNASFISGQLRLLADTIDEAKLVLKGGEEVVGGRWWEDDGAGDETNYDPTLPPALSPHLSIASTSLLLTVRTLQPFRQPSPSASLTGLSLRQRLGLAGAGPAPHDETDQVFLYRGQEVRVVEKVRIESQDPSLMAVMAKLSALGHAVAGWRGNLATVMGVEEEEE
ncbi:MAG: hypothetical protein LQ342_003621 [Letrouitia transgressa]|nr:MAG: hypothetical protein LQ342_003621 [Letrouitia transgressa]